MVPFAPVITGITFAFTCHIRCTFIVGSVYFIIPSASFCVTILSPEIAAYYYYYYYYYLSNFNIRSTWLQFLSDITKNSEIFATFAFVGL